MFHHTAIPSKTQNGSRRDRSTVRPGAENGRRNRALRRRGPDRDLLDFSEFEKIDAESSTPRPAGPRGTPKPLKVASPKPVVAGKSGGYRPIDENNGTASPPRTSTAKQIAVWLDYLAASGQCIALWIKSANDGIEARSPNRTGYFTDRQQLIETALAHSGRAAGVYITVNPIARKLLDSKVRERARNKVSPYFGSPKNDVIYERRRLLIDVDPKRPADTAATDAEKRLAYERAMAVAAYLDGLRWPKPLVVDSGNGTYVIYRVKLPVDDGGLVRGVLAALASRFGDDKVGIDTSVSPAKQLMRLPGTLNCKGPNTADRPHRVSRVLEAPAAGLKLVAKELLEQLVAQTKAKTGSVVATEVPAVAMEGAAKYLAKMPPAVQGQSGSLAAIKAARAIVVGFGIPHGSEAAWTLLQAYNVRCVPPWALADANECNDLRRKLAEADANATLNGHERGYLRRDLPAEGGEYEPLEGPAFPVAIPDYYWMGHDTPNVVLDEPPVRFAYGLRLLRAWQTLRPDVRVPDVLVKSAHWGAKAPRHWRQHYRKAMAAAKKKFPCLKGLKACDEHCALAGSKIRHRHYQLADATCGVFDHFRIHDGTYDFSNERTSPCRKSGKLYWGYWPALVFGTAKPMGLTPQQVKLLMTITRELTRVATRPTGKRKPNGRLIYERVNTNRPDRAQVIQGNKVHDSGHASNMVACPYLDRQKSYVAFAGNLRLHRGRGYRLVTWADRAGYQATIAGVKAMLADLKVLANFFELTVVGRHHRLKSWYTVENLADLLGSHWGVRLADKALVRIYAPADFLTLWRYRIAQRLGFQWIFGGEEVPFRVEEQVLGTVSNGHELLAWLKRNKVTREKFAAAANISRTTLYRYLKKQTSGTRTFWENVNRAIQDWFI